MKSFKKFVLITLLPIILIATVSILISKSLEDVSHFSINVFVLAFFSIISFCYVYIYEKLKIKNIPIIKNYIYSILSLSSLLFLFIFLIYRNTFFGFTFKIGLFQTTLGVCVFLTIIFISEIYKQSISKDTLTIKEKPMFFLSLIVKVVFALNIVLFILTSDYYWDKFIPLQIADIIIDTIVFNLIITLISFGVLTLLYTITYFRKNVILGVFLASLISGILNFHLNHFSNKNILIGYPNLFAMCFFCCSLIVIKLLYKNKIQNLYLSFSKKETEYLQLKNQINPHFLFNNLNTLIAFIESNPQKAIEFGQHLSNVYRHYLKSDNNDFVQLEDEINFIKEYMAIFKAKFEDGFTFEIINGANENQYILSLSLQELIDNIFKHNILDIEDPVAIELTINKNELNIRNTKRKKEAIHSTKKGLKNINKRYNLLTKKEISIIENDTFFEVKIPILYLTK